MGRHSRDYEQEAQEKADSFDRQHQESQERAAGKDNSALGQYERGIWPGKED